MFPTFRNVMMLQVCMGLIQMVVGQKNVVYNIESYGAKSDGQKLNTTIINQLITNCSNNGGGTVLIPKGVFLTGTIYLKSHVRLELADSAELRGAANIKEYKVFVPTGNLHQYSTISADGNNANSAYDTSWTKALMIGQDIEDVTITGNGMINGQHVFDAHGEEKMRGPHAIILSHARNITFDRIQLSKAANYAILGYDLQNVVFQKIHITEGWDGIHIRGGKHIQIRNSQLETGDDAIAGGYWEDFVVTDSYINSSCNGIRIIMPISRVEIAHSYFSGPGKYPHRTSQRTNMLAGLYVQPGGWGTTVGNIQNLWIHDLVLHNMENPLLFDLNKKNDADHILMENIEADSIKGAIYCHSFYGGIFKDLTFRNLKIHFITTASADSQAPWFLGVNHAENVLLENIDVACESNCNQNSIDFQYIKNPSLIKVQLNGEKNGSSIHIEKSWDITYRE